MSSNLLKKIKFMLHLNNQSFRQLSNIVILVSVFYSDITATDRTVRCDRTSIDRQLGGLIHVISCQVIQAAALPTGVLWLTKIMEHFLCCHMGIVTAIGCQGINELDRADEERLRCWTKSISHQNTITQSTGQPLQDPARLLCLFCILSYSKHIIFHEKVP